MARQGEKLYDRLNRSEISITSETPIQRPSRDWPERGGYPAGRYTLETLPPPPPGPAPGAGYASDDRIIDLGHIPQPQPGPAPGAPSSPEPKP